MKVRHEMQSFTNNARGWSRGKGAMPGMGEHITLNAVVVGGTNSLGTSDRS